MLIQETPLQHWMQNFYGYGSWDARIWLIAYEEGGGDLPEEVADKIKYFYSVHPEGRPTLCDVRELYRKVVFTYEGPKANLFRNLYDYRFDKDAILHNVWKNLISFTHGYEGKSLPDFLTYQKDSFASPSKKKEAWIKFYPLPSSNNHAWYYSWLDMPNFPFLKSRKLYEDHLYESRMKTILQNIDTYKPELVLMYGMNNINTLKQSVQEFFPTAKFKSVKAIKMQIPQHHRAEFNGTTMLITTQIPALRHNRIETGFDWEAFGKTLIPPIPR